MSVNKVQLANGETIIDISDSTVTPETLSEGVTAHDASGKKITGKMIPGGGGGVQPDWNQTDETAADFIKNKPFGEVPTVILEEQEIAFDPEMGLAAPISSPIQHGDNLIVIFDGDTYICDAMFSSGIGAVIFGNQSLMGGEIDTGEPFLGAYMQGMAIFLTADEIGHTVGITLNVVKAIPEKYMATPKLYMKSDDIYIYTDAGCTTKATILDVPDTTNFYIGMLSMGSIISWYRPVQVYSSMMATAVGYNEVTLVIGNISKVYTAEYTPKT